MFGTTLLLLPSCWRNLNTLFAWVDVGMGPDLGPGRNAWNICWSVVCDCITHELFFSQSHHLSEQIQLCLYSWLCCRCAVLALLLSTWKYMLPYWYDYYKLYGMKQFFVLSWSCNFPLMPFIALYLIYFVTLPDNLRPDFFIGSYSNLTSSEKPLTFTICEVAYLITLCHITLSICFNVLITNNTCFVYFPVHNFSLLWKWKLPKC